MYVYETCKTTSRIQQRTLKKYSMKMRLYFKVRTLKRIYVYETGDRRTVSYICKLANYLEIIRLESPLRGPLPNVSNQTESVFKTI